MIGFVKDTCCGCEACANICSKGAIRMVPDEEGFFYPSVDTDICIDCHLCEKVCPVIHADEIDSHFTRAFSGMAKDEEDIIRSSSGGFAAVLARNFILDGGVVYGVSYSEDYKCIIYQRAGNVEKIECFRGSKYAQSRKHNIYREIQEDLGNYRKVLFIGTPCDAYALSRFVRDKRNLYIVAIVCHGPTSPMLHEAFCTELEKEYGAELCEFSLRYKNNGNWKPYYIRAVFKNEKEYLKQFRKTDYETIFQYFKRPSCGECIFKGDKIWCDILIGDNHAININSIEYNQHGVSSILPLSEKAFFLLGLVRTEFSMHETDLNKAITQKAIHSPVVRTNDRRKFMDLFRKEGLHSACQEYTIKVEKRREKREKLYNRTIGKAFRYIKRFIH